MGGMRGGSGVQRPWRAFWILTAAEAAETAGAAGAVTAAEGGMWDDDAVDNLEAGGLFAWLGR